MSAKKYFTEEERREARRATNRRYYHKNKDRIDAQTKSWRFRNPEKYRAYMREYKRMWRAKKRASGELPPLKTNGGGRPRKYFTEEERLEAKRRNARNWYRRRYHSDPEFRDRQRGRGRALYAKMKAEKRGWYYGPGGQERAMATQRRRREDARQEEYEVKMKKVSYEEERKARAREAHLRKCQEYENALAKHQRREPRKIQMY